MKRLSLSLSLSLCLLLALVFSVAAGQADVAGTLPNPRDFFDPSAQCAFTDYRYGGGLWEVWFFNRGEDWGAQMAAWLDGCEAEGLEWSLDTVQDRTAYIVTGDGGTAMLFPDYDGGVMLMKQYGLAMDGAAVPVPTPTPSPTPSPVPTPHPTVAPAPVQESEGSGSIIITPTQAASDCPFCGGSGYRTCKSCDGKGYVEYSGYTPQYGGIGNGGGSYTERKPCPNIMCNNGQVKCTNCGGTGKLL